MLIVVHRKVAAEQVTAIAPKAPTVVHLDNAVPTYWTLKARHTQGRRSDSLQERNRKKGQHAGEKEEILLRFSYHAYLIGGRDKNGYATRKRQKWMEYPKHTHFFFFQTEQNKTKRNETKPQADKEQGSEADYSYVCCTARESMQQASLIPNATTLQYNRNNATWSVIYTLQQNTGCCAGIFGDRGIHTVPPSSPLYCMYCCSPRDKGGKKTENRENRKKVDCCVLLENLRSRSA